MRQWVLITFTKEYKRLFCNHKRTQASIKGSKSFMWTCKHFWIFFPTWFWRDSLDSVALGEMEWNKFLNEGQPDWKIGAIINKRGNRAHVSAFNMPAKNTIPVFKFTCSIYSILWVWVQAWRNLRKCLCTFCLLTFVVSIMAVFLSLLSGCNISETTCTLSPSHCSPQKAQKKVFLTPPPPFSCRLTALTEDL